MAEHNFRGWHALVAIAAFLGFLTVEMLLHVRPMDDEMRDAVREELLKEYSGQGLKDVVRILAEAREGSPIDPLPPMIQRDVEFTSIAAHGGMGAPVTLIRAEVTVGGGPPPDRRPVRYFCISRKFIGGGWMVVGESNSYRYYKELAP